MEEASQNNAAENKTPAHNVANSSEAKTPAPQQATPHETVPHETHSPENTANHDVEPSSQHLESIGTTGLRTFVRTLCRVTKRHSEKENAKHNLDRQLTKIKTVTLNKSPKRWVIEKQINIPCSIFTKKLSSLETISKYLKENLKLSYKEIADLINRSEKTIWQAYKSTNKKHPSKFVVKDFKITFKYQY